MWIGLRELVNAMWHWFPSIFRCIFWSDFGRGHRLTIGPCDWLNPDCEMFGRTQSLRTQAISAPIKRLVVGV
jgi:hypothetical protein